MLLGGSCCRGIRMVKTEVMYKFGSRDVVAVYGEYFVGDWGTRSK